MIGEEQSFQDSAESMHSWLDLLETVFNHIKVILRKHVAVRDVKILTDAENLISICAWNRDVKGLINDLTHGQTTELQLRIDSIESQWSEVEKGNIRLEFWYKTHFEPQATDEVASSATSLAQLALAGQPQEGRAVALLSDEPFTRPSGITSARDTAVQMTNNRYSPLPLRQRPGNTTYQQAPIPPPRPPPPPYMPVDVERPANDMYELDTGSGISGGPASSNYREMRRGRRVITQIDLF